MLERWFLKERRREQIEVEILEEEERCVLLQVVERIEWERCIANTRLILQFIECDIINEQRDSGGDVTIFVDILEDGLE